MNAKAREFLELSHEDRGRFCLAPTCAQMEPIYYRVLSGALSCWNGNQLIVNEGEFGRSYVALRWEIKNVYDPHAWIAQSITQRDILIKNPSNLTDLHSPWLLGQKNAILKVEDLLYCCKCDWRGEWIITRPVLEEYQSLLKSFI